MAKRRPWLIGLIDGLCTSNLIKSSLIAHKNRFAFIVLDSTLEIAFKNFLVNEKKITNIPETTWKFREKIIKILKNHAKFEKDVWYVDNRSLCLDIKIIFLTFINLIRKDDINHDGHASMPEFMGNDTGPTETKR